MDNLNYMPQDDGESDEEDRNAQDLKRRVHPLHDYGRKKFRKRYRLTKPLAQFVIGDFIRTNGLRRETRGGAIDPEDRFCIALRYLATGANMEVVADHHGVDLSSVSKCVTEVINYFNQNSYKFIKWPENIEEKVDIADVFDRYTTKPRCIGIVDGTHIAIRKPHINSPAYVGKPKYPTLNAMVVCDYNKIITHINPGWAGSVQDSYAYNCSEIKEQALNGDLDPFFLLADKGYGCQTNLFTPVDNPITDKERAYNKWQRKTRSIVEVAIGQMKNRWRCLDDSAGYLFHAPEKSCRIIIACACLHNLCQKYGVPMEFDDDRDARRDARPRVPEPVDSDDENEDGEGRRQNNDHEHATRNAFIDECF